MCIRDSAFYVSRLEIVDFLRDQLGIQLFSPELYIVEGIPAQWISEQVSTLLLISFIMCIILTAIPAIRAALLSPVNALRHN